jgi:hypothetical protein
MWLIDTESLALEAVVNTDDRPYAILSHTWGCEEVSFYDISHLEQARGKQGFSKIEQTCRLARDRGIKHAWVDTCCIDKSSSAELTEAINSMFQWYKNAKICFVFLSDLPSEDSNAMDEYLPRCRWFTRGWTLQELIASKEVEFYDQGWNVRGTKVSLQGQLLKITGVETKILEDSDILHTVPIARRMSWAARRRTTRVEDIAYCLFGIFDVNLPLIYGEGQKAFIRLQEAIAQENSDLSLFAWTSENNDQELRGILAKSPAEFKYCGLLEVVADPTAPKVEFSMTNRGFLIMTRLSDGEGDHVLQLGCLHGRGVVMIRLVRTAHGYVRHKSHLLTNIDPQVGTGPSTTEAVDIPKTLSSAESRSIISRLCHRFTFHFRNTSGLECDIRKIPQHLWDNVNESFITDAYDTFTGVVRIDLQGEQEGPAPRRSEMVRDRTYVHRSSFVAIFGLGWDNHIGGTRNIERNRTLTPWAGIYRCDVQNETSRALWRALSRVDTHGYPDALREARAICESHTSSGQSLPQVCDFIPDWKYKSLTYGTFNQDYFREGNPSILVASSTGVKSKSDVGMYELIINIERGVGFVLE